MQLRRLSRQEVREVDQVAIQQYGMPGVCLMENAGRGAAEVIAGVAAGSIWILCGAGNNGGDGFVIARHLENMGLPAQIVMLADPNRLRGDALVNWQISQKMQLPTRVCTSPSEREISFPGGGTMIDALLGTGARGQPREPFATAIRHANAAPALRIAIDLPSGLDCDTGQPAEACFRADHTCTFVAEKQGFASPEAAAYIGTVHVIDIGAPHAILRPYALR